MSDTQYLPGYSLLLASPQVGQLLDLSPAERTQFFEDLTALAEAVKVATACVRVNLAIYGNVDPFLHAHVWPRFEGEPEELRTSPPLTFPPAFRDDPERRFNLDKHGELLEKIRSELARIHG